MMSHPSRFRDVLRYIGPGEGNAVEFLLAFIQGGPECSLPVLWAAGEGGIARESKNEPEKKGTVRSRAECLKKNTETCFDKMERIRLPLVKTMPAMHSRE